MAVRNKVFWFWVSGFKYLRIIKINTFIYLFFFGPNSNFKMLIFIDINLIY